MSPGLRQASGWWSRRPGRRVVGTGHPCVNGECGLGSRHPWCGDARAAGAPRGPGATLGPFAPSLSSGFLGSQDQPAGPGAEPAGPAALQSDVTDKGPGPAQGHLCPSGPAWDRQRPGLEAGSRLLLPCPDEAPLCGLDVWSRCRADLRAPRQL